MEPEFEWDDDKAAENHSKHRVRFTAAKLVFDDPFAIERVFSVRASAGATRGRHAHRQCTQFLTCASGAIEIMCDDGSDRATYLLERPDRGLLVPKGIWAEQTYRTEGAVLLVLCDRAYDEADYIRDYSEFLKFRTSA